MLELDLVLNAFLDKYLPNLAGPELATLRGLLERPDPVLLDFVMGHAEPEAAHERDMVALMRSIAIPHGSQSLAPTGEIRGANG